MDLTGVFDARRFAIVGDGTGRYFADHLASNLSRGGRDLTIHPIHPKKRRIRGLKVHRSLTSLPARPDVVMLLVSATEAIAQVRIMAKLGIRRAIVLASGFTARQTGQLCSAARKGDVIVLGPESLGAMDVPAGVLAYFGRLPENLPSGCVSIVSQSGGLFNECLRVLAHEHRWGLRRTVCVGTQAVVGIDDATEALADDQQTGVIAICLEQDAGAASSLRAPIERAMRLGKHVIVFSTAPVGLRNPGLRADASCSSMLAGNVVEALATSTGCFLARDIDELAEAAAFASDAPSSRPDCRRVSLVSVSKGVGQWMATEASGAGLEIEKPGRSTVTAVRKILGRRADVENPLDLSTHAVTDPKVLTSIVDKLANAPSVGAVMVAMHPPSASTWSDQRNARWLEHLAKLRPGARPVVMAIQPTRSVAPPTSGIVRGLSEGARILSWWLDGDAADRDETEHSALSDPDEFAARRILHGPARRLSEPASRTLLGTYAIALDDWFLVETGSQASRRARSFKAPVRLKIASPDIVNIHEASLVRGGLTGDAAVRDAYLEITDLAREEHPEARILGVIVTPDALERPSLFITTLSLGPHNPVLLMCGAGGPARASTRTYQPVLAPVGENTAMSLARRVTNRCAPGAEIRSLAALIRSLGRFAHDLRGEVSVVDIETVGLVGDTWRCLDASVTVSRAVDAMADRI